MRFLSSTFDLTSQAALFVAVSTGGATKTGLAVSVGNGWDVADEDDEEGGEDCKLTDGVLALDGVCPSSKSGVPLAEFGLTLVLDAFEGEDDGRMECDLLAKLNEALIGQAWWAALAR